MKGRKIPTLSAILLIITAAICGTMVTSYLKSSRMGHSVKTAPKDLRISNITSSSFTISWITDIKTVGAVKWGSTSSSLNFETQDQIENQSYTHSATIENLLPSSTYFFVISSDNRIFDNNKIPWQVMTAPKTNSSEIPEVISGSIYDQFNIPSKNTLVYVTVAGSNLLSTVTSENGSWVIPISQARTKDLTDFVEIDDKNSLIEISIYAGPSGIASAQIYPAFARPAPPIILGQTYNFKADSVKPEAPPKATINLPEEELDDQKFPSSE